MCMYVSSLANTPKCFHHAFILYKYRLEACMMLNLVQVTQDGLNFGGEFYKN